MSRLRIEMTGKIQGVGFRPYVYRIAKALKLTGFVFNHVKGVTVEVQGEQVDCFQTHLLKHLPPLAKVDGIDVTFISCDPKENDFTILESSMGTERTAKISPDTCVCPDCLKELFDPDSRYYHYPFLNCTNCGPRFTIIRSLPYDRAQTTMDIFPLCGPCHVDYKNPDNRRYHAQPTACLACGPRLSSSIEEITDLILKGNIVAIKGLGGYQLLCDAYNEETILKLRQRKCREAKPFALMVANIESVRQIAHCNRYEEALLMSRPRPIVLLRKKKNNLALSIAKDLSRFGVLLPSTPLHYLLFNRLAGGGEGCDGLHQVQRTVLVATSANISRYPLIIDDQEARGDLPAVADHIVSYNRQILMRADDSVLQVVNKAPFFIRRARGYVPESIPLKYEIPSILAVGGHLKNTFCITRGNEAFISPHIGDLDNVKAIDAFHESLDHLLRFLNVKPDCIAHDGHPDFYTTRFAKDYGIPAISVLHHHAHLASVAAEHHINEPALGLALDGYGYGEKGEAWGGELLLLDEKGGYQRLGRLRPLPQIGGDRASKESWRMAAGVLHLLGYTHAVQERFKEERYSGLLMQLLEKGNYSSTSSCGRLFDAASALLGIRYHSHYEGQAAMEMESLVTETDRLKDGWRMRENELNVLPLMDFLRTCQDKVIGANIFHGTLVAAFLDWLRYWRERTGIRIVLLGGGCFLNHVLSEKLVLLCQEAGFVPLLPRLLPPNDGGLCLGQAWVSGSRRI